MSCATHFRRSNCRRMHTRDLLLLRSADVSRAQHGKLELLHTGLRRCSAPLRRPQTLLQRSLFLFQASRQFRLPIMRAMRGGKLFGERLEPGLLCDERVVGLRDLLLQRRRALARLRQCCARLDCARLKRAELFSQRRGGSLTLEPARRLNLCDRVLHGQLGRLRRAHLRLHRPTLLRLLEFCGGSAAAPLAVSYGRSQPLDLAVVGRVALASLVCRPLRPFCCGRPDWFAAAVHRKRAARRATPRGMPPVITAAGVGTQPSTECRARPAQQPRSRRARPAPGPR